jgi:UPF0755 protein
LKGISKRTKIASLVTLLLLASCAVAGWVWYRGATAPMPDGEKFYVRYEEGNTFEDVVNDLVERKVIRDARGFQVFCYLNKRERVARVGTFEFHGGMTPLQVSRALRRPIEQQVRIPEGWWIARVAERLEKNNVCTAAEYIAAANSPQLYKDDVAFPLPATSLEGYLYPDTYDLPPLIGADAVIKRQLKAFEEKVWNEFSKLTTLGRPLDLHAIVTTASLVELEAGVDEDRPRIAGVINNRLAIRQRLQIDATALYAIQEWRVLKPGEIATIESPYNTYKIDGLPPGPIGSPAWRSISAVLAPEAHAFLYYVARPDRTHYFSATYDEHLSNIKKARQEFADQQDA